MDARCAVGYCVGGGLFIGRRAVRGCRDRNGQSNAAGCSFGKRRPPSPSRIGLQLQSFSRNGSLAETADAVPAVGRSEVSLTGGDRKRDPPRTHPAFRWEGTVFGAGAQQGHGPLRGQRSNPPSKGQGCFLLDCFFCSILVQGCLFLLPTRETN